MASGKPDWHGSVSIEGKYNTTLVPIKVDDVGQLYALLRGVHDTTPLTVQLDADGNLIAVMKGIYDTTLKTIAVDSNGIIKANLFVQDLTEIITRPKYGAAQRTIDIITVTANSTTTLITVSGKGILYGGTISQGPATEQSGSKIRLEIDDEVYQEDPIATLWERNFIYPGIGALVISYYDDINHAYTVHVPYGITFETSVVLKYVEMYGDTPDIYADLKYALI